MQNREFEKKVQQKMEELKLPPSAALWDKVEAALPAQKKPRRWIIFFWLLAALVAGTLLWKPYYFNSSHSAAEKDTVQNAAAAPASTTATTGKNKTTLLPTTETKTGGPAAAAIRGTVLPIQLQTTVKPRTEKYQGTGKGTDAANDEVLVKAADKNARTKSTTKIKIKAPGVAADAGEITAETTAETDTDYIAVAAAADTTPQLAVQKTAPEPVAASKQDSPLVTAARQVAKKPAAKKPWQFGLRAAAGRTQVKNGFLTNQPAYYNLVYAAALNQGPPAAGINNNSNPAIPAAGAAFTIGLAAEKNAGKRWRFVTGLNYVYHSTALRVGSRVDSAVTIRYDANKSIQAGSYYRDGNAADYKNNFHLLELPVLLQYTFSQKIPVYAEAGATASYLLHSNALVYYAGNGTYFTDAALFNRLLLTANAGAGVRVLQKTNYPVSIGFQLRQGMMSVIQPSFGRQHFVNTLLYARVLLKK